MMFLRFTTQKYSFFSTYASFRARFLDFLHFSGKSNISKVSDNAGITKNNTTKSKWAYDVRWKRSAVWFCNCYTLRMFREPQTAKYHYVILTRSAYIASSARKERAKVRLFINICKFLRKKKYFCCEKGDKMKD